MRSLFNCIFCIPIYLLSGFGCSIRNVYADWCCLVNFSLQSDSVLFESLRRLQLMGLTVDTLKV